MTIILEITKGISTMQNSYRFPQSNNCVVNLVYHWQLGFITDGKTLHCKNCNLL